LTRTISADWVLPVDGPPLRDGFVAWDHGRITEVGPGRAAEHLEGAVIMPGIVNAHSHLEYAVYAGFGDGEPFGGWLATHILRKSVLDHEAMLGIARRGAADSLAAGITTTADYSYSGVAAQAAAELGLRATVYLEVFASEPAVAERQFEETRGRLPETDLVRIGVSPHAPYTCSVAVYEWALSLGIPVGTHLAESASEQLWLENGTGPMAANARVLVPPTGKRAVATLADVLCPELLCAHCVEVTPGEIALLAGHDVPVAHCPRSNAMLGCGIAPLAELRAAGLRVGLGTDSPASTPSIDPWEELRTAVYAARARERDPGALGAAEALQLATIDAARALGLADEIGSLTPGKRADLTVLSLAGSPYDPVEDPAVGVVFGGSPAGVLETIVDGETRYRQGENAWHEVRSTASAARRRMLA
jgi:cytosine/adenosine deaminase-related metal-dependent hydrolase